MLIPFERDGDYDYQALVDSCQALIVKALVPPIDKSEAWDQLMTAIVAAGITDVALIIEALYAYREALLKWQREEIDGKLREAELAIRVLRGYTRGE